MSFHIVCAFCLSFWPPASVSWQHGDFGLFTVEVELPAVKPEQGISFLLPASPTKVKLAELASQQQRQLSQEEERHFVKGVGSLKQTLLLHYNICPGICLCWLNNLVTTGEKKQHKKPGNTGAILLIKTGKDCCQANGLRCERGRMSEGWKESRC